MKRTKINKVWRIFIKKNRVDYSSNNPQLETCHRYLAHLDIFVLVPNYFILRNINVVRFDILKSHSDSSNFLLVLLMLTAIQPLKEVTSAQCNV